MIAPGLAAALRACATGTYPAEAGTVLLTEHDVFLHRADFTDRYIWQGTSITGGVPLAQVDWSAAIRALGTGEPPCSQRPPHPRSGRQPRRGHSGRPQRRRHRPRRPQHPQPSRHPPRVRACAACDLVA